MLEFAATAASSGSSVPLVVASVDVPQWVPPKWSGFHREKALWASLEHESRPHRAEPSQRKHRCSASLGPREKGRKVGISDWRSESQPPAAGEVR